MVMEVMGQVGVGLSSGTGCLYEKLGSIDGSGVGPGGLARTFAVTGVSRSKGRASVNSWAEFTGLADRPAAPVPVVALVLSLTGPEQWAR